MRATSRLLTLLLALAWPGQGHAAWLGPGEPLTRGHLEALLQDGLAAAGAARHLELQIAQPALPMGNHATVATELALAGLEHDARTGRFSALLVVRAGERRLAQLGVHGRALPLVEVPVPARPLAAGTVVGAGDLDHVWLAASRLGADHVSVAEALIGAEARRPLAVGRPVRERDVGPPRLVARGRTVTMVYAGRGLRLSASGRALEDGALGESVRVANADSNRQIQAVVSGPDEVTVGP